MLCTRETDRRRERERLELHNKEIHSLTFTFSMFKIRIVLNESFPNMKAVTLCNCMKYIHMSVHYNLNTFMYLKYLLVDKQFTHIYMCVYM